MSLTKYHFDFNLENCVFMVWPIRENSNPSIHNQSHFQFFFTLQEIKEYMLFLIVSTLVSRNLNFLFFYSIINTN